MRPVDLRDLLPPQEYEGRRAAIRRRLLELKRLRRVSLGHHLTFHFENPATIAYQVQEIVRAEGIVEREAIEEELGVYNRLFGGVRDLGCTLMLEIPEEAERRRVLPTLASLPLKSYLRLPTGRRVFARSAEPEDSRPAGVHFLWFPVRAVPWALGVEFDDCPLEVVLPHDVRAALAADIGCPRIAKGAGARAAAARAGAAR